MHANFDGDRIGVALSGGGIRAAIFHLGVLEYLAKVGLFEKITSISSVSGASICIGLIFAANKNKWPSADEFSDNIRPMIRELIIGRNIQRAALLRLPFHPHKWRRRVEMLADMLEKMWGITGSLQDLPSFPFWEINCTTFETGNRFRFRKDYMGDQKIGYVQRPNLPISHMIAASAAFPVLIGPYVLKTDGMVFTKDKFGKLPQVKVLDKYTLWDGGVYDNLGLDALHKIGKGLDSEIDFAIVSNASASIGEQRRGRASKNLRRLLDIATAQTDILRSRDFISSIVSKEKGLYLKIGHNPDNKFARNYPTTLNSPREKDFDLIFQNGYETAEQALTR
ncbi:MAG: patatin-like phospholipase family protein [Defluviitaleaceae bacterium]|nr:patatin-like phospholipase family protein [Defluviitaleaceae bacterium]MCL2264260.1 patatin-like phospholipase family protein [Defluviitaleaceae bacterium]